MHEEITAKVSLNVIVGSSEDNQPFNIDIVMSAKFSRRSLPACKRCPCRQRYAAGFAEGSRA